MGAEREFAPDRVEDDLDDPDLGAAALDDDAVGGGSEIGGSGFTAVSMTGLMMMRPILFRAASQHPTIRAWALLAGRLHGAARRSAGRRRLSSVGG